MRDVNGRYRARVATTRGRRARRRLGSVRGPQTDRCSLESYVTADGAREIEARGPWQRDHSQRGRCARLQPEEHADSAGNLGHRDDGYGAQSLRKPTPGHGARLFGDDVARHGQTTFRRADLDSRWQESSRLARDGKHGHEPGRAGVERIGAEYERRPSASLLVADDGIEIGQPDFASPGCDHERRALRRGFLAAGATEGSAGSSSSPSALVVSHGARSASSSAQSTGSARSAA